MNLSKKNLLSFYLYFSLASSLIYFFTFYFTTNSPDVFEGLNSLSILCFGNFLSVYYFNPYMHFDRKFLNLFFLFQTVCFVAVSVELSNIVALYFALLPSMFNLFIKNSKESTIQGFSLLALTFLTYISASAYFSTFKMDKLKELFIFAAFTLSSVGIFYSAIIVERSRTFRKFFKLSKVTQDNPEKDKIESLFFHDLLNQTHGMSLFMQNKIHNLKDISPHESKMLLNELRTIQQMIQDHFGLNHKNMVQNHIYLPLNEIKGNIDNVFKSFLNYSNVKIEIEYPQFSLIDPELVNAKYFLRILVNLVKNVSEARSEIVSAKFEYTDFGLVFTMKNSLDKNKNMTAKQLEKIILADDYQLREGKTQGLGLESVGRLCDEIHGQFKYRIEGDFWISEVILPRPYHQNLQAA